MLQDLTFQLLLLAHGFAGSAREREELLMRGLKWCTAPDVFRAPIERATAPSAPRADRPETSQNRCYYSYVRSVVAGQHAGLQLASLNTCVTLRALTACSPVSYTHLTLPTKA